MKKILLILMTGLFSLPSFSKTNLDEANTPSIDFVPNVVDVFFADPLVSNLGIDECTLGATNHTLTINNQTGLTTLFTHSAAFFGIGFYSAVIVVVTSGCVDPSQNSDGSGFGLYVALASDGNRIAHPGVALFVSKLKGDISPFYLNDSDQAFRINSSKYLKYDNTIIDIMGREGQRSLFGA